MLVETSSSSSRLALPHAPGRGARTARRSTATRGSRSSGRRSRRSCIVALCTYAYVVLRDIEEAAAEPGAMRVRVIGEQFAWTFFYRGDDGGKAVARTSSTCPRAEPLKFDVRSKDVIHDFWVPAFRMKIDAVPGHHHELSASRRPSSALPDRLRRAVRARPRVHAPDRPRRPQEDFDAWLRDAPAAAAAAAAAAAGRAAAAAAAARRRRQGALRRPDGGATAAALPHARRRRHRNGTTGPNLDDAQGQGRRVHPSRRSSTPTPRSPRASRMGSCRQLRDTLTRRGARRAGRLPCRGGDEVRRIRLMAARLRAPGWYRALGSSLLGVAFSLRARLDHPRSATALDPLEARRRVQTPS